MSARSFEHALCRCRQALYEAQITSTRRPLAQPKVSFSTTRTRQRTTDGVPSFSISSSSELNELLLQVRTKIFLPAFLRNAQRKLIYKDKFRSMLENDPVVVEVGSESFTLQHLDRTKDIPDSWKSVKRAMDLMGSESSVEWNNVVPLLQGIKAAKRNWKSWQYEKVVRRTGDAGMANVIVDALQQVETTGLSMSNLRVARESMWACRTLGFRNGWDQKSTEKALRLAQHIATLMEEKGHRASNETESDPRSEPDIIGVLLELTARQTLDSETPESVHLNRVKLYVERLLPNLERALSQAPPTAEDLRWAWDADVELLRWTPVWKGLEIATTLLGDTMPQRNLAMELIAKIKQERLEQAERAFADNTKKGDDGNWKGITWSKAAMAEKHGV